MSILDTDLYKLTQQQVVLELYPKAHAVYTFINRRTENKFNNDAIKGIKADIQTMDNQSLQFNEKCWLKDTCPYLKESYLEYLANYRYNPNEVFLSESNGDLNISIQGPWHKVIFWEIPLLSIVSKNYFKYVDTSWDYTEQKEKAQLKAKTLADNGCYFADFGTRRRRHFKSQDIFVSEAKETAKEYFVGTSNVHLAHKYNIKPIGTMAHELFMGTSALCSLRHANRYALKNWIKVYGADLGIALTDTFGSEAFFKDFNLYLAKTFDGVRQDSGNPFDFVERVIAHYDSFKINPLTKTIVFSDNLDVEKAVKLKKYCENRIKCSFGIGTHFTNSFDNSPALNIVIKLSKINGIPVVKLSDDKGKEIGDKDALKVAKWTFFGLPLEV